MQFLITGKSSVKLPNSFIETVVLNTVSAQAFKTFLFVTALFQQVKRPVVSFKLEELDTYLNSGDPHRRMSGSEYRRHKEAIDGLFGVLINIQSAESIHGYMLFSHYRIRHKTGVVTIWLQDHFKRLLDKLGDSFYTLVPLLEAKKLNDTRHLVMLVWCSQFLKMHDEKYRRVPVEEIRRTLDLSAPSYQDWSRMNDKLRSYTAAINKRTDFRLKLNPIKEGTKVVAVQFDVTAQRRIST